MESSCLMKATKLKGFLEVIWSIPSVQESHRIPEEGHQKFSNLQIVQSIIRQFYILEASSKQTGRLESSGRVLENPLCLL